MTPEKPRISRLTAILTQLQSKQILTAREIADKHSVSIRTIYRDIRTLENSGIPIYTEEGKGYSLVDGFNLPPVMFTKEEANALITAQQLIAQNKDSSLTHNFENAIAKVKAILKHTDKEKAELLAERIIFRKNSPIIKTSSYLMVIQNALVDYNLLDIKYQSIENKTTQRTIEPFALYSTQDNWLLIAFCRLRKEFRAFRLDNIQNLNVMNQYFEPHNITLEQYFEQCREKYGTMK